MDLVLGVALIVVGGLGWGGQLVSAVAPATAVRFGLSEAEDAVEPVFWADVRGEATWDSVTLWALPVAGVLLIADSSAWPYFGLAGGAVFAYFAGRGITTRREMLRRGFRIGTEADVRLGLAMLALWGVLGIATIAAAVAELS